MRIYGFNLETLYHLDLAALYEICQLIRDDDTTIALDHDVMIRGCIIPFLRNTTNSSKYSSKDEIMKLALISTAKKIGVNLENWDSADVDDMATATRRHILTLIAEKLETLSPEEKEKILGIARNNLAEAAKTMGLPIAGAGAIAIGELSGFGVYLATTTGLKAISIALGTTFSWGVYQGATTLLGIILGPVGWAIMGLSLASGAVVAIRNWMRGKQQRKLVLVVIMLLLSIGENPFSLFGLTNEASFEDVKRSYRAMMKTFHPDKLEKNLPQWVYDDFNEKLLRCQEAYEHLQRIYGEKAVNH